MFLVVSGISNQLKNLFSRHPNIPEASRNDPWQNLKNHIFHHFGRLEVMILVALGTLAKPIEFGVPMFNSTFYKSNMGGKIQEAQTIT